jgi:endonuclease G
MAKKKPRAKSAKRGKKKKTAGKTSPFLTSLKHFAGIVSAGAAILMLLLQVYDYKGSTGGESVYAQNRKKELSGQAGDAFGVATFPEGGEQPRLSADTRQQLLRREGYTVSYNPDYRIPNWVAWVLTREEAVSNKAERTDRFVPDPDVNPQATATGDDYRNSGFDRGHIAPAADMKWSHKAMRESFYFSNICPQNRRLNTGIWNTLERQSRTWAAENGAVYIASGPVIRENLRRLGKNRVAIPEQFFKAICTLSDNKYHAIAFLLENREYRNTPLPAVAISVDSLESLTGIDFFPLLPDNREEEMEATVDLKFWFN